MIGGVLYNEIDPFCADWLENLILAGVIAPGDVDRRSIEDVTPDDVRGYTQFHAFAGIGVWSYALRLAGWPDDRPVWTGSCPCQPFSAAGKGGGSEDHRHLWPAWFRLIKAYNPTTIFGEQVASASVVGKTPVRSGTGSRLSTGLPFPAQSAGPYSAREIACLEAELALRSGQPRRRDTEAHRLRLVRDHGAPVESEGRSDLGQSFAGSARAESGLRVLEYPGGLSRHEQRHGRLGRESYASAGEGPDGEAERAFERIIEALGRGAEEAAGGVWLDALSADLERAHYTVGTSDIPVAGVGGPHIRQRLFFVGLQHAQGDGRIERRAEPGGGSTEPRRRFDAGWIPDSQGVGRSGRQDDGDEGRGQRASGSDSAPGGLHDAGVRRQQEHPEPHGGTLRPEQQTPRRDDALRSGVAQRLPDDDARLPLGSLTDQFGRPLRFEGSALGADEPLRGFWSGADWIWFRDGKYRPVESGTFPLVTGASGRVGRLRAYGNSVNAEATRIFIEEAMKCMP